MQTSFVGYFTLIFFLLSLMKAKGSPAYSSVLSSDLTDLKNILERLEDRVTAEEPMAPSQDLFAQNYDAADSSNSAPSWTGEAIRPQSDIIYNKGSSWETPDKLSRLKSKLRELLNSPRSLRRSSDCFGGRIDRIGAQSGMGCNSHRF
ncbi:atrial natriuretic factor precursor [Xenopus laevis]|uniref:Natriuretic peptides A n=2 Tax=Xenopus laevis TaxID=8355 RepID=Q9DGK8_XENLA|nr:atrial natriuretic factor precursor [Xenopus laevis]AAG01000.1 atrial natriuretic factor [Xenopus laevis]OCT72236.1 hypothetical protein XELAEV_18035205mg [Xenopus laevis]